MRTFTAQSRPPILRAAVRCETCKLTNTASMPTKASYGEADMLEAVLLGAQLSAKPCGCQS